MKRNWKHLLMWVICVFIIFQVSKGVITYVFEEVKKLYHLLENGFHPSGIVDKVESLLGKLSELSDKLSSYSLVLKVKLEQHITYLEMLTTLRVL